MKTKKRFRKLAKLSIGILLDFHKEFKLRKRKGFRYAQSKMEKTHTKRARQLLETAISYGGVLIKLCQFLSTRRDVMPEPYIEILSPLQDSVPPIDFKQIKEVIKSEYEDYTQLFSNIEPIAIASASLGQVHRATLIDGSEVVLKVLKPGVEKIIDIDFAILYYIIQFITNIKQFSKSKGYFLKIFNEFVRITGDELNFKREGIVAKEFQKKLAGKQYLKIPEVYSEYTTQRILIMEFVRGDKISQVEKWEKRNNNGNIIAKEILDLYIEQFLYARSIHFDPHPGNILITDNNNIILLDFGMSGTITDAMSDGVKDIIVAFIKKDYSKILDVLYQLGFLQSKINKASFVSIMQYIFGDLMNKIKLEKEAMQNIDLSPVIDDIIEILYSEPFYLPVEWAYIGRTAGALIGIISTLNPDFNIYEELKPYKDRLLKENLAEIVAKSSDIVKSFATTLVELPNKATKFIDDLEVGNIRIAANVDHLEERFNNLKTVVVKSVGIGISFFSFVVGFVLYTLGYKITPLSLAALATASMLFSVFYKNTSKKDAIKKRFL